MRPLAIGLAVVLAAARGDAKPRRRYAPPPPAPPAHEFWRDLIAPHQLELDRITSGVRESLATAAIAVVTDDDPTEEHRGVLLGELAGVLRYARQLAPHDPDILRLAGEVAEELGHPSAARAAFIAAIDAAPHSGAPAELYGELGVTELRLGRTDEAIDHLRRAQLPIVRGQTLGAQLLVHLADALAERGDMAGAIDALVGAMPPIAAYYPTETALVSFALAVQYDRDDQRGAAFEVLDRLQRQLQGQFGSVVQTAIAPMRFAPAEDQHYYWGLFYEAAGDWIEARAEWALYAASGGAPFRRRALEHIAELDRLRRAPAAIVNAAKPPAVTP